MNEDGEPMKTKFIGVLSSDEVIQEHDTLILIGDVQALSNLPQE